MNKHHPLLSLLLTLSLPTLLTAQQPPATTQPITTTQPDFPVIDYPHYLFNVPGNQLSQFTFPPGQDKIVIPISQGLNFWATNKLKINGQDTGWLLIDTGANLTTIDSQLADELNLEKPHLDTTMEPMRPVAELNLAGLTLRNTLIGSLDFSSLRHNYGFPLKGSLGGDIWGRTPFSLDFAHSTLTFYNRSTFHPPAHARQFRIQLSGTHKGATDYRRANRSTGIPTIPGQIGKVPAQFTLDTGATDVILGPKLSRNHPELIDWSNGIRDGTIVAGGSANLYWSNVHQFLLFDRTFTFDHINAETQSPNLPGAPKNLEINVGASLLQNFRLTFDYAAQSLWIEDNPLPTITQRLAAGTDPNAQNLSHQTLLMVAARQDDLAGVKALLAAGARTGDSDSVGRTALYVAVSSDDPALLQTLLAADKSQVNAPAVGGTTPLMNAMGNHSEVALIQSLLDAGADVSLTNSHAQSPLFSAASYASAGVIPLLAAHHADFNATDDKHLRPLDAAALHGRVDTLQALWHFGARPSHVDGRSLLHFAAQNANPAMLKYILQGREEPVIIDARSGEGFTPLMIAAENNLENVNLLLAAGANLKLVTSSHASPLYIAAPNHPEIVQRLLQAGAQPNPSDPTEIPPLFTAAENGNAESVKLLLDAGASTDIRWSDAAGATPLQRAALNDHSAVVKLLLDHKANPNFADTDGDTPLMAAAANSPESLLHLLHAGAALNAADSAGATPLSLAAFAGNPATTDLLIQAGANLEAPLTNGARPLLIAVEQQHPNIVRLLLQAGANPAPPAVDNRTPLSLARSHHNQEIITLLQSALANPHPKTQPAP